MKARFISINRYRGIINSSYEHAARYVIRTYHCLYFPPASPSLPPPPPPSASLRPGFARHHRRHSRTRAIRIDPPVDYSLRDALFIDVIRLARVFPAFTSFPVRGVISASVRVTRKSYFAMHKYGVNLDVRAPEYAINRSAR